MNQIEANDLLDNVALGLWPDWSREITEPLAQVWKNKLKPYDFYVAKIAMQEHYAQSSFTKKPILRRVITIAKEIQRKRGFSNDTDSEQMKSALEFSCQCIEAPKDKPGYQDYIMRFFIAHKKDILRDPDRLRAKAQTEAQACEQLYGGKWIPILEIDNEQTEI